MRSKWITTAKLLLSLVTGFIWTTILILSTTLFMSWPIFTTLSIWLANNLTTKSFYFYLCNCWTVIKIFDVFEICFTKFFRTISIPRRSSLGIVLSNITPVHHFRSRLEPWKILSTERCIQIDTKNLRIIPGWPNMKITDIPQNGPLVLFKKVINSSNEIHVLCFM